MFLVFSGCSHLLTDVFKMCSDDLRCSEDHKCWMLDFLQIFSRCSLDVFRMFSGFSQDVLMGLVGMVGLEDLVGLLGLVGLVGLVCPVSLVGLVLVL